MRATLSVRAEAKASNANKVFESASKHIADRKRILEQSRNLGMKRLNSDIEKIAKSELDFAKRVIEELVPVKITFQQDAWNDWVANLPVRITMKENTGASAGVKTHGAAMHDAADDIEPAVNVEH
jgi:hypothetical protein